MERKLIAVAVSTALGMPLAADAVDFAVSGQVNRSVVLLDQDGNAMDGDIQHIDGPATGSRLEFKGSGDLDNGLTAGFHLEYGVESYSRRFSNVYVASPGGTLTVGWGNVATDGMAHARLGGPSWLGGVTNWCAYATQSGGGIKDTPACNGHDGGRQGVVRYDTPAIGPLSIAASVGQDEYWDVKAKIAGSFGDSGYDLRVGYIGETDVAATDASAAHTVTGDTTDHELTPSTPASTAGDTIGASAAVKFPQGTSIAAAWGQSRADDTDSQYVELDHSYGAGSIGVSYRQGETGNINGSTWSIGVGHALGNATHAYAGYRMVEGDDIEDAAVFYAGMRVRFN